MADLAALRADAAQALYVTMTRFRPRADAAELRAQHDSVALQLHTIAVACLLVDGNARTFFLNLVRCAENGRRFLALFRARGLPLPPASRNVPLVAGLAAGDFARASAIAALSNDARDAASHEYEHEFLWARAFQLLAPPAPDPGALGPVLDRLEILDPAAYGDRTAAIRALLAHDPAAFERAMIGAALHQEQVTEERARAFTTPVTTFAPHRFLWLEGLALLRLGERAGLSVDRELRGCPRLARVPVAVDYDGDWAIETGE